MKKKSCLLLSMMLLAGGVLEASFLDAIKNRKGKKLKKAKTREVVSEGRVLSDDEANVVKEGGKVEPAVQPAAKSGKIDGTQKGLLDMAKKAIVRGMGEPNPNATDKEKQARRDEITRQLKEKFASNPQISDAMIDAYRAAGIAKGSGRKKKKKGKAVASKPATSSGDSTGFSSDSSSASTPRPPLSTSSTKAKEKTPPHKHYATKEIMITKHAEMYKADNNVSDDDLIAAIVDAVEYTEEEIKAVWGEIKKLFKAPVKVKKPNPSLAKKPKPAPVITNSSVVVSLLPQQRQVLDRAKRTIIAGMAVVDPNATDEGRQARRDEITRQLKDRFASNDQITDAMIDLYRQPKAKSKAPAKPGPAQPSSSTGTPAVGASSTSSTSVASTSSPSPAPASAKKPSPAPAKVVPAVSSGGSDVDTLLKLLQQVAA